MELPRFAIKYRSIFIAAVAVAAAWGALTFATMPRRVDPEYTVRVCQIITRWDGATAEDMELMVTDPIEEGVSELDEVMRITSKSLSGQSIIVVKLEDRTSPREVDNIWDKVRAKVDLVKLPTESGCGKALVNSDFGDTAVLVVAVYQKPATKDEKRRRYTPREMEIIADRLKDEIQDHPDAGATALYGVQEEVIYLEADAGTWSQLALTTDRMKQLLEQRNIVAPGGSIETDLARFGVKPTGEFQADSEIKDIIVGMHADTSPIYLADLGIETVRTYRDPPVFTASYLDPSLAEPVDCISISVMMKNGRNVVSLGESVGEILDKAKNSWLPDDIVLAITSDQPVAVQETIANFSTNLWQAMVIVVAVAYLLIGLRVAIVMAAAIPMVVMASLGTMPLFGVQLEQISIAALIIALGMLVDNAVEVCDNTHRLLEEGVSRDDAAARGAGEIAFPILIATLTTLAAFLPMLSLPGSGGEYIYSLPVVVSATLMISWFVAMTVTTVMAWAIIRKTTGKAPLFWLVDKAKELCGQPKIKAPFVWLSQKVRQLLPKGEDKPPKPAPQGEVEGFYDRIAHAAIRGKWVTLAVAFAMFFGAVTLMKTGQVGSQYFPGADLAQFIVEVDLPEGAPFSQTREVVDRLGKILRDERMVTIDGDEVDALKNAQLYVGGGGPKFYLSLDPKDTGANRAFAVINTTSRAAVEPYLNAIRAVTSATIPGARVSPQKLAMGPGIKFPVQLRVMGPEIATLRSITQKVEQVFRETPGTWDVNNSWGRDAFQIYLRTDEDRAKLAGVTNAAVARTSNAFFSGHYLTTYREGDHRVGVYFRLPGEQRKNIENIRTVYVEGAHGKVPIDAVADTNTDWVPGNIERRNRTRTIEVNARVVEGMLANSVLTAAMDRIHEIEAALPAGYRIEIGGEQEETTKSQADMQFSLMISLLVILLLLVIMFNSMIKPLIILLTLPLAVTGAILGLWIHGQPMGFMSMLGIISLAGVVINTAIVLIEFVGLMIKEKLASGQGLPAEGERAFSGLTREAFRQCVVDGSKLRILPIMLTTLTTVGGLIPLAMKGGPLFEPMATVLIYGLLLAAALTLLVIPALLCIFNETFHVDMVKPEPSGP